MVLKLCTPRQGKTKVEVAKMIQATKDDVVIKYNKLHADPKQGAHCTFKKKTPPHDAPLSSLSYCSSIMTIIITCSNSIQLYHHHYHVSPPGKTLDLILKKVKHKMTETTQLIDTNTNTNIQIRMQIQIQIQM